MNHTLLPGSRFASRLGVFCGLAFALLFAAVPRASALSLINHVEGSGTNTLTSVVTNPDGTVSIEAEQAGTLSGFGTFTGHFAYTALPSPTGFILVGSGEITNTRGEHLSLLVAITETGADYPFTIDGLITIIGGTGRFAGATGALHITGVDTAEPVDFIHLDGVIVAPGRLL